MAKYNNHFLLDGKGRFRLRGIVQDLMHNRYQKLFSNHLDYSLVN